MSSLDSIEGPLKEKIADLECRLKEAEANFKKVNGVLERSKASASELRAALIRTEDANQEISIELEEEKERYELEIKKLCDQVLEL